MLITTEPPLQSKKAFVDMGVLKNWDQLGKSLKLQVMASMRAILLGFQLDF